MTHGRSFHNSFTVSCLLALAALPWAAGQAPPQGDAPAPAMQLHWQAGPSVAQLGRVAELQVPQGFSFVGGDETRQIMEAMQNPVSGLELGFLAPDDDDWFVIFEFEDIGYVSDDDADSLDAAEMLDSIREGNEQANDERRQRGWAPLDIVGWEQTPHYDPQFHSLVWAIRGRSEGEDVVNFNMRLLGRSGVMVATLVGDPARLQEMMGPYRQLIQEFDFTPGNRYAEFRSGDRMAQIGLTALVVGGTAAVAAKTGLLKALAKGIGLLVLGVGAFFRKIFKRKTA